MILNDLAIRAAYETGHMTIAPFHPDRLQPASYDVDLGHTLALLDVGGILDLTVDQSSSLFPMTLEQGRWLLQPHRVYLGTTAEYVEIPANLIAHLHGRSTLARAGITIHQQAGLLDPGYCGNPTVEISVMYPVWLWPGAPIGQIVFEQLVSAAIYPYGSERLGSHYQGDRVPMVGRPIAREVSNA